MKRKIKYLTAILLFVFLFYTLKTSYSRFNTQVEGEINNNNNNLEFAKFYYDNTLQDSLDFEIKDMVPGEEKTIDFNVANYNTSKRKLSDVKINYKIKLKSYMLPLEFQLISKQYQNILPFNCTGYLGKECESNTYNLNLQKDTAFLRLKIIYPSNYNEIIFKNNIDNIHLEIEAWQKTS